MIVLDTHTWVWWVSEPVALSTNARRSIEDAANAGGVYLSSMSVWEIAMLVSRKRLELTVDLEVWLRQAESLPYLHFVPLDNGIAIRSVILADFPHPDPVDRIIAATALVLEMPLVTKDRKLRGYSPLRTIW